MLIKLINYESIVKGEILLEGLVGLVGTNNIGKSAFIRAITDFCQNTFTKEKINWHAKEGTIQINDTILKRIPTQTSLIFGGEEKIKLDGKSPIELCEMKDLLVLNSDKLKNYLIQFSFQRETLPPFDLSASQLFYLFSMLFDMKTIDKIFMTVKETIKNDTNELKYLKGKTDEILKQKLRLQTIQDKLPLKEKIDRLEYKYVNINKLLSGIKKKDELERKMNKLLQIKEILKVDSCKEDLKKIKIYMMAEKLGKLIELKKKLGTSLVVLKSEMIEYLNNQSYTNKLEIEKLEIEKSKFKICPLCNGELNGSHKQESIL